jgi:GrpB-like predicted nucleotidyltransferase (UPF0157 family)
MRLAGNLALARMKARTRSTECSLTSQSNDSPDQPVIVIADYDPGWPLRFAELGSRLRQGLGLGAVRIDHIGSTAVPGLAAKPVIDIQVSVERLEPAAPFRDPLQDLGFTWRAGNADRTKRYFRERPGQPRTHIHVRQAGSFSEQFPLLFRDFLRVHREAAAGYEAVKRRLAARYPHDRQAYTDAKAQIVWDIIQRADDWAQKVGWEPGPSDA